MGSHVKRLRNKTKLFVLRDILSNTLILHDKSIKNISACNNPIEKRQLHLLIFTVVFTPPVSKFDVLYYEYIISCVNDYVCSPGIATDNLTYSIYMSYL